MEYSKQKPDCWGDPDCYEPNDDECNQCKMQHSCGIRVSSKSSYASRRQSTTSRGSLDHRGSSTKNRLPTRVTQTPKPEIVRAEPEDDVSFGKLLLHNTGLEVLQTTIDELSNSVRAIPRYDYGKFFERKKK